MLDNAEIFDLLGLARLPNFDIQIHLEPSLRGSSLTQPNRVITSQPGRGVDGQMHYAIC